MGEAYGTHAVVAIFTLLVSQSLSHGACELESWGVHEGGQQALQLGAIQVQAAAAIAVALQHLGEAAARQAFQRLDRFLGTPLSGLRHGESHTPAASK